MQPRPQEPLCQNNKSKITTPCKQPPQHNIKAHYEVEQFTYYNVTKARATVVAVDATTNTVATSDELNGDKDDDVNNNSIDSFVFLPAVTVDIKYATTTYGGNIVVKSKDYTTKERTTATSSADSTTNTATANQAVDEDKNDNITNDNQHNNFDITGILIWPATHLLCQYLVLEYTNLIQSHQQQLGNNATIVDVTTAMNQETNKRILSILELGCGCGTVGSVFMKYHTTTQQLLQERNPSSSSKQNGTADTTMIHWYATDMDCTVLELCYDNLQRNICTSNSDTNADLVFVRNYIQKHDHSSEMMNDDCSTWRGGCIVQQLSWGSNHHIKQLLFEIQKNTNGSSDPTSKETSRQQQQKFDIIVAADIIYPSQNEFIIQQLFETIQAVLCPDYGYVILSYCNRDYTYTTILNFIRIATHYQFVVSSPDASSNDSSKQHLIYNTTLRKEYLPPLLDGQILLLRHCNDSEYVKVCNSKEHLGHDTCLIFPKLYTKLQTIENNRYTDNTEDNQWDGPPIFDDEL